MTSASLSDYIKQLEDANEELQKRLAANEAILASKLLLKDLIIDHFAKAVRARELTPNIDDPSFFFQNIVLTYTPENIIKKYWGDIPIDAASFRNLRDTDRYPDPTSDEINAFQSFLASVIDEYKHALQSEKPPKS